MRLNSMNLGKKIAHKNYGNGVNILRVFPDVLKTIIQLVKALYEI